MKKAQGMPGLGTSSPTRSLYSVSFELLNVPPNWLNWNRGLKERISLRAAWKDMTWAAALIARNMYGWLLATAEEFRYVSITCYRVKELDEPDGLSASIKPIVDGLKAVQYKKIGGGGRHTFRIMGPGLIYDDSPQYVKVKVKQIPVAHYADEKTFVEVSLVDPP